VPSLRALLIVDSVALVLVQAGGPIEVAYVKATLHGGDRGYGLLVTTWGAGAVLASIVFARALRRPLGGLLAAGIFALGAAFVGFSLAPTLALACLAAFVGGVGNGLDLPSPISLLPRLSPQHLLGRMMGATESLAALSLALGLPLGGALVALSSPRIAFLTLGVATLITTAAVARLALSLEAAGEGGSDAALPASQPIRPASLVPPEPSPD